jgi:hypothetical protein
MTTPVTNAVSMTDIQQVTLTVMAEDSKGQPVADAGLTWSVDNGDVVSLQPSADGTSCLCVAGIPGTANVTVSDGSSPPLTASEALTVTSSAATQLVVTAGTPEAQPAPATA